MTLQRLCLRNGASILAALFLGGCGFQSPTPPTGPADDAVSVAEFTFAADSDPAVAALPFVEDELLVQPFPGADAKALADLYKHAEATVVEQLPEIDVAVLRVSAESLPAAAATLAASGLIETLQKNYIFTPEAAPNDPLFTRQEHLTQIGAAAAWDISVGASTIPIAIVDTGVDGLHADLAARIIDGWNLYNGNADFADVMGHGTQVAGVAAAASNNGVGVAGVTWDCPVIAVRVGDSQGLSTARHIAGGILWAASHGAKVINVSFAPLWSDQVVRSAAQQAFSRGALVVISAGNGGGTQTAIGYDEGLFVAAVNPLDEIASFSDRGPFVDISAPGTGVRTTTRGGDYGMANGTSFAAPIVSGVAALVWSVQPDARPVWVQQVLLTTARDLGVSGDDAVYGVGLVDAAAAVAKAAQTPVTPDTTPPSLRLTRPSSSEVLTSRYTVAAEAGDASGVADVVLSVDGVPYATDTRAPYQLVIDPRAFSTGNHTLALVATDVEGNASAVRSVSVRFNPTSITSTSSSTGRIQFRSPAAGATVSGDVSIQATVSDSDGLAVVEWFVDGQSVLVSLASGTSTGVSYLWRATGVPVGSHTVTVAITDSGGGRTLGSLTLVRR